MRSPPRTPSSRPPPSGGRTSTSPRARTTYAHAPTAGRAFRSLAPASAGERALDGGEERIGTLPDDAETALRALGDPIDGDDPLNWRAFDVGAVFVRDGETPLYHSVPHEFHVREVYAADAPAYRDAVRTALSAIDGVALYPAGPLLTWRVNETAYELTPTSLRYATRDGDWRAHSLDRLAAAETARGGRGVDCEWRSMTATARDPIQRALGRVYDVVASEPPGTVPTGDASTTEAVLAALSDLAESLGYAYAVSRR
ncbi:hypothetical protein [Halarchaeum nitratireducens]|uniref:Uncharacterized protein n=1 Tax=Halarchaeum nitratireducens TaxID=489913 RepID=A0A830GC73_9EURY|nr:MULTISPECIES: hypothetical protein [Halarchaeum]MBP2252309.1 hypothetical protein [Halarchaeum solikamskense]GGN17445.1 hypothetical protein GCM10009021_17830 [Halarchaeum nitratireducens]